MVKVNTLSPEALGRLKEKLETNVRQKKGKNCKKGKTCKGSCIAQAKQCDDKPKGKNKPVTKPKGSKSDPKPIEPKPTLPEKTKKTRSKKPPNVSTSKYTHNMGDYKSNISVGQKFTEDRLTLGAPSKKENTKRQKLEEAKKALSTSNPSQKDFGKHINAFRRAESAYYAEVDKRKLDESVKLHKLKEDIIKHHKVSKEELKDFRDKLYIYDVVKKRPDLETIINATEEVYSLSGGKVKRTLVHIDGSGDERAYANQGGKELNVGTAVGRKDLKETVYHEAGHHVEYSDKSIKEGSRDWLESRATSYTPKSLNEITGHKSYGDHEVALPDNFINPYVGKIYGDRGASTEVVSMGLEHFTSGLKMRELLEKDPEHFYYTVGVLLAEGAK